MRSVLELRPSRQESGKECWRRLHLPAESAAITQRATLGLTNRPLP
jgi:hypothetical protein